MSDPHESNREALLESIATGEVGLDDPSVSEWLQDERFRDDVEMVLGVQEAFDELAQPWKDAREGDFDAERDTPEAARLASELTASWAVPQSPARRRFPWLPLAAAVLFFLFALRLWPAADDRPTEVILGESLLLERPVGDCETYAPLQWDHVEGFVGRYVVRIFEPSSEDPVDEETVTTNRWKPTTERTAGWPDEIQWQVSVYDSSGQFLGSLSAQARRSSSD